MRKKPCRRCLNLVSAAVAGLAVVVQAVLAAAGPVVMADLEDPVVLAGLAGLAAALVSAEDSVRPGR